MAVFIETRTDPFVVQRENEAARRADQRNPGNVRRPLRGFEIKQDTYAVLRVMKANGEFISVIDAAGDIIEGEGSVARTNQYTNFFIQQVAEERHEKQQIVDTFGDAFIFFFGEAPRIAQVSGFLLNTADFNWRNEFWDNYERYFRGTRLVEQNARLYLIYDDIILEGYMLGAQAQDDTNRPHVIQFSFTMFISGYSTISALGNPNYPSASEGGATADAATQQTSLGQSIQRAQGSPGNQADLRETNTQIAGNNLRRSGGPAVGSIGKLAQSVRNNSLLQDPSTESTVSALRGAYGNTSQLTSGLRSVVSGLGSGRPSLRQIPLRGTFASARDEFVGGIEGINTRQLANTLNLSERWQTADAQIDNALSGIVDNVSSAELFDVLGRGGRAVEEMRSRGSVVNYFTQDNSQLIESTIRRVPFGMVSEQELNSPDITSVQELL